MKCMGAMVLRFQMKIHLMPDIFFFNLYVNKIIYIIKKVLFIFRI